MSTLNEGAPRHVLGRPIRHVRQAASTSTTHSLPFAPPFTNAKGYWNDSLEECSGEAISTPQRFGSPGRKASVVSQNAFLTLPPHLHHLLRTPVDSGVPQSRPTADSFEQPFASPSARQAAELALLLAERLGEDSPASPQQTPQPARCPRSHPFAKAADLDIAPVDPMDAADALEHESTPRSVSSDLPVFEDLSNLFWKPGAIRSSSPTPRAQRPAPNPLPKQPWPATSFGRVCLGDSYQGDPFTTSRDPDPPQPNNHSRESFFVFGRDEVDGDGDSRGCVSPSSFIDLDYDFDPHLFALKRASVLSAEQRDEPQANATRSSTGSRIERLSIDSRFFLSPLQPLASPYMSSDASRNSTLNGKLEDFPAPPSSLPQAFSETIHEGGSATRSAATNGVPDRDEEQRSKRGPGRMDSRLAGGHPADLEGTARRSTGSAESAWFADSSGSE